MRAAAFFPVAFSFADEHLLGPTAAETWVAIESSRMAGIAVAMSLFMGVPPAFWKKKRAALPGRRAGSAGRPAGHAGRPKGPEITAVAASFRSS